MQCRMLLIRRKRFHRLTNCYRDFFQGNFCSVCCRRNYQVNIKSSLHNFLPVQLNFTSWWEFKHLWNSMCITFGNLFSSSLINFSWIPLNFYGLPVDLFSYTILYFRIPDDACQCFRIHPIAEAKAKAEVEPWPLPTKIKVRPKTSDSRCLQAGLDRRLKLPRDHWHRQDKSYTITGRGW